MATFNDRLLFIHIPKCGGTSVRRYMEEHVPGWRRIGHKENPSPIGHIPLRDVEGMSGRPLDSWDKIVATVRDPYTQQLSQWLYWWHRHAMGGEHFHDVRAAKYSRLEHWLLDTYASDFHVWYEERVAGHMKTTARSSGYMDFGSYYRYWLEVDGAMPPHLEVVRMEDMAVKVPAIVAPFTEDGAAPTFAKHINRGGTLQGDVMRYYSPLARQVVEQKFNWAFEHHYERWTPEQKDAV